MRIHKVTMTGFGPYKGTEVVDFDDFEADGLFLISGKTGAGKTSILDAVTFALYGRIPRYEGVAGEKVRSDHIGSADPCEVVLEFTSGGVRYRVTRSPEHERPKQRGQGFTTEAAKAEIARRNGSEWEVLETQVRNVELRIGEVLHLNPSQFQQVILLAQGRFQEFLVANSDTRRELLRTLFGTKRFSDYTDAMEAQARALRVELAQVASETKADVASLAGETGRIVPDSLDVDSGEGVLEWARRLVVDQQAAVAEAEGEEKLYKALLDAAAEQHETAKSLAQRQERRAGALLRQEALAAEADSVAEARTRLDLAARAELAWPVVKRHLEAEADHSGAVDDRQSAGEEFRTACPAAAEELGELDRAVVELTETIGSLRDHHSTEQSLPDLAEQVVQAGAALREFDTESGSLVARQAELRRRVAELDKALPTLSDEAGLLPEARARLERLDIQLNSARKAEQTAAELARARAADLEAGADVTAASRERDVLRARQLGGYAAVLAEHLTDGDACPVCGSLTHPMPAEHGEDRVTDGQLRQAQADYEAAVAASQTAGRQVSTLAERLDHEQEQASSESVAALSAHVELAATEVNRLAETAQALQTLNRERSEIDTALTSCATTIDSRQEQRISLVSAHTAATTGLEQARLAVDQARAGHASVAERLSEVGLRLRASKRLQQTVIAVEAASKQLAAAADDLDAALTEQGFGSRDEVLAARVPAPEQKVLRTRVDQHAADTTATKTILAAEDLQGLPADPVDVAGPATKHAEASDKHLAAVGRRSRTLQKASTLTRLAEGLTARLGAAAEVRERCQVVGRLAATMKGQSPNTRQMSLESFVLAAELEEIVRAANGRLRVMTSGRYEFQYSDALAKRGGQSGLSLDMLDAHTGEARSPQSLSGGEQFQASLALALGLAEVVSSRNGGIKLDTLFVDEGFGSLSDDTLETTMATLDSLREGGRIVGLISHVQSMKETIPAQLRVNVTDGGWSTIEH